VKIRYVGPSTAPVIIPAAGYLEVTPGEPVEVPNAVGQSLCEQVDNWRPVGGAQPTVKEILAEVGDDPDAAEAALNAEQATDSPRPKLVGALEAVIASAPDPDSTTVQED
jgi:hypothetical protein